MLIHWNSDKYNMLLLEVEVVRLLLTDPQMESQWTPLHWITTTIHKKDGSTRRRQKTKWILEQSLCIDSVQIQHFTESDITGYGLCLLSSSKLSNVGFIVNIWK